MARFASCGRGYPVASIASCDSGYPVARFASFQLEGCARPSFGIEQRKRADDSQRGRFTARTNHKEPSALADLLVGNETINYGPAGSQTSRRGMQDGYSRFGGDAGAEGGDHNVVHGQSATYNASDVT